MDNKAQFRLLFEKYINGTITDSESAVLKNTLDLEEYNTDTEETIAVFFHSEQDSVSSEWLDKAKPIVDDTWMYLNKDFDTEVVKRVRPISRLYRYAAAVLLAVSLTVVGYYYKKAVSEPSAIVSLDVEPGGNRATLTLGDGNSIALSEEQSALIVSEDGMSYGDGTGIPVAHTEMATIRTPRAGQYQVSLSDGTEVWLNASSSLCYPVMFNGDRRVVQITGEVYFDVAKDNKRPFIVQTEDQEIEVLGTSFNINSYTNQENSLTTLIEGSLRVRAKQSNHSIIIKPGQQAIVSKAGEMKTIQVDAEEYAAWKEGVYIVNDLTLDQFGKYIERWYDVDVDMGKYKDDRLSATIRRDVKLKEVLDAITLRTKIKFVIKERRVSIAE
ncbi:FecR family protein [Sphingobacterium tabacisoli]|uniref:FecR family protein n=1 Tax=Sphingobacterium tabacisoli TaxID=2044855 RepID=A0ABW5L969_9SPHI|nr:FecR family protein [Sphingobacterium tabacisoli]